MYIIRVCLFSPQNIHVFIFSFVAQLRSHVIKPTVPEVPQIQTKPEALAAQVAQYKSTVAQPQQEVQEQQQPELQQVASSTSIFPILCIISLRFL